ncbi:MAG: putative metal-dependent hydrolase [Chitinophagaceae bacterium]|nr:putative metal-dependent hydrolase [Chitinophagaceae bacterium]
MSDLKYPVGEYVMQPFSNVLKKEWLLDIQSLPLFLENAILNLDEQQLNVPYREGGWTVKQVIHHWADSHMNDYVRFKLGFTEDNPVIEAYDEVKWAELDDVKELPINISITLLHALHIRWYAFLQAFTNSDFDKTIFHPGHNKEFTLWQLLGMYAWHGRHHVAHITTLRKRMKW